MSGGIKFGVGIPTIQPLSIQDLAKMAINAEKAGYDSIWCGDHPFFPEWLKTFGGTGMYDPLVSLSAFSSVTDNIRLGTGVLLPLRAPVVMANEIATLDHACNGRFILGMGVGDQKREYDACGVPYHKRGKILDETVMAIKALWKEPKATFSGEYFQFNEVSVSIRPKQKPHPPIWFAGRVEKTFERIAKMGDGWAPAYSTIEEIREGVARIKELTKLMGRDWKKIEIAHFFTTWGLMDESGTDEETTKYIRYFRHRFEGISKDALSERTLIGNREDTIRKLREFKEAGATYFIFGFLPHQRTGEYLKKFMVEVLRKI